MRISNFRYLTKVKGEYETVHFAEVDVTTGRLWWGKTVSRRIARSGSYWFFTDTGKFTPGNQTEDLERAFKALSLLASQPA